VRLGRIDPVCGKSWCTRQRQAWPQLLPALIVAFFVAALLLPAAAQAQQQRPLITLPARILAPAAQRTPFAIGVVPEEGLPRNTYLRIRGLPRSVALS